MLKPRRDFFLRPKYHSYVTMRIMWQNDQKGSVSELFWTSLGTLPVAIWTISLLYVRVNHFRVRLYTGKITRGEVSRRQRRSFSAYPHYMTSGPRSTSPSDSFSWRPFINHFAWCHAFNFGAFLHTRRVFMRLPVFPTGIRGPLSKRLHPRRRSGRSSNSIPPCR